MDLSPTTWVIIVVVLAGIGLGVFLFLRNRGPKDEEVLYLRCPGCKRRLKYHPRQIGHKGMCSNCKEQFVFPSAAAAGR
jgi:hypothetical protein